MLQLTPTIKYTGAFIYAIIGSTILTALEEHDSYIQILIDPLLWIAAFIGLGLMLFVERSDEKERKLTTRGVFFSIFASIAFIFVCIVVRAGMYETGEEVGRSYIFYIAILFFSSIAPELARRLIVTSPKFLEEGINNGIKRRAENIIGGPINDYVPDYDSDYEDDNYDYTPRPPLKKTKE